MNLNSINSRLDDEERRRRSQPLAIKVCYADWSRDGPEPGTSRLDHVLIVHGAGQPIEVLTPQQWRAKLT